MKIYIIAKDSEYKKEKTKDKINHYIDATFESADERKIYKYQNKILRYSTIVKLYNDHVKNDPEAVLVFSDIHIFLSGETDKEIDNKIQIYIYFIRKRLDIRFINTPFFDTRLFYNNLTDEHIKTATSIVHRQINELRKKEENDRQFIGKQTSKGINQTKEKSGGILQKRVYITKKRKVILDFMFAFFDTKKELPNFRQFKDYIEMQHDESFDEEKLFCDVPLSKYHFGDVDPEDIFQFENISLNTYKKYLEIAEQKQMEKDLDELKELGISFTELW